MSILGRRQSDGSHVANWYATADIVVVDDELRVEVELRASRHDGQPTDRVTILLDDRFAVDGKEMTTEEVMRRLERPT